MRFGDKRSPDPFRQDALHPVTPVTPREQNTQRREQQRKSLRRVTFPRDGIIRYLVAITCVTSQRSRKPGRPALSLKGVVCVLRLLTGPFTSASPRQLGPPLAVPPRFGECYEATLPPRRNGRAFHGVSVPGPRKRVRAHVRACACARVLLGQRTVPLAVTEAATWGRGP